MKNNKFILNNRFLIDPILNLIIDNSQGSEHRIEPRLISILCLLAEREGQLVTREELITKVWNDYGGADDSLNQAISYLRKEIKDVKKETIETIPKKGYVFHGKIQDWSSTKIEDITKQQLRPGPIALVIAGMITLLITAILFYVMKSKSETVSTEVNFSTLPFSLEDSLSNTISTVAPDGTRYRVFAKGDERPRFYVNDRLISEEEQESYTQLEKQLLKQLWDRKGR